MVQKIKVAVVFGGQSSEHEVSRVSAESVLKNLDENKYDIIKVGITKEGIWNIYNGAIECIGNGEWEQKAEKTGIGVIEEVCSRTDVIFPVLHGRYGEDGAIQGLFEMLGKPYVGPGILGSALGMDKGYAKIVFEHEGIPQARCLVLRHSQINQNKQDIIRKIEEKLGYPCFVKPSNAGSSVGISKAHDRNQLEDALELAAKYDKRIIVEEYIDAREIECSVLGNDDPIASVLGEIIPSREFYDYDSKYNDGTSQTIIPAKLDEYTSDTIREYAVKAFKALDCDCMARIDFFVHKVTGKVYINEINTIPGFTSISMYPKLLEATGIRYSDLLDKLIELAFDKYHNRRAYE